MPEAKQPLVGNPTAVPLPLAAAGHPAAAAVVSAGAGGDVVRRTVLPGGVRVLTESMPGLRSATFGIWVGVGSRDEADGHHGSTHFLEHLLFKGTSTRTAMEIASAFDAVGGEANAVTGKEHTCYYARVLDEDLPMAAEVIGDMVTSATLRPQDVDSERGVILEELAMNDDDPADVVHERFAELVLAGHELGRPIGGTPATIEAVGTEAIVEHYHRHYRTDTLVVTAAGGVDHDAVCEMVSASIERSDWQVRPDRAPSGRRDMVASQIGAPEHPTLVVRREIEQANLVLGCSGLTATDDRRFTMSVLNAILGGGMSSRLFQEIREKRGLAYTVYSFGSGYADAGYFGLYAGCMPGKIDEVLELMVAELGRLATDPIPEEELARAHGQLCGGLVLGLEESGSRMSRLGKAELVHGEFLSMDGALQRLRAITADQVQELAADLLARPRSLAVVGPFDPEREFASAFA